MFIDWHRLEQYLETDVTRITCPIIRHFQGALGIKLVKEPDFLLFSAKKYTPLHVYWKSTGRGFTKYKMHRQRLYRFCCFEVNVGEVFVHCKQKEGRTRRQYCSPVDIKMNCFYNYCAQSCAFYVSIPFSSIYNQSIPIYLSIDIDNRYQSITTQIFAIDWY